MQKPTLRTSDEINALFDHRLTLEIKLREDFLPEGCIAPLQSAINILTDKIQAYRLGLDDTTQTKCEHDKEAYDNERNMGEHDDE